MVNVLTVFDRVCRRFTYGDCPRFSPEASDRASDVLAGRPVGEVGDNPASASRSKCAFRVGDDMVEEGWKSLDITFPSAMAQSLQRRLLGRFDVARCS